jgi:hypothetical protein
MTHLTAQQRARRRKRNPWHNAKLAPAVRLPANVCGECGEPELICQCRKETK